MDFDRTLRRLEKTRAALEESTGDYKTDSLLARAIGYIEDADDFIRRAAREHEIVRLNANRRTIDHSTSEVSE